METKWSAEKQQIQSCTKITATQIPLTNEWKAYFQKYKIKYITKSKNGKRKISKNMTHVSDISVTTSVSDKNISNGSTLESRQKHVWHHLLNLLFLLLWCYLFCINCLNHTLSHLLRETERLWKCSKCMMLVLDDITKVFSNVQKYVLHCQYNTYFCTLEITFFH